MANSVFFALLAVAAAPVLVLGQSKPDYPAMVNKYCVGCHNDKAKTGGLTLQSADLTDIAKGAATWEKVIRKLRVGSMPPQTAQKPDVAVLDGFATYLETSLDRSAAVKPNPGHATMHRLNRAEYANAIRDVLGLDIDAAAILPPDDESSGFDNIADVLRVSPSLMERYLSASWNISRLALANPKISPTTTVYRVAPDLSQDQHIEGLPLGTRGGARITHTFPADGEYAIKVRLWRNTFDLMRGMEDSHEVEIAVDGVRVQSATFGGREDFVKMAGNPGDFGSEIDKKLTIKMPLKAGPHVITAATVMRSHAIRDDEVKPFLRTTIDGLDITGDPSVDRVSIEGPFQPQATAVATPARAKILTCKPANAADELPCARRILASLARRAYRRPVKDTDMEPLLSFYQRKRNANGNFEQGIESAVQLILASPEFLFRFEGDPENLPAESVYRLSDLALASRLSFFLWSSVPDEPLLTVALQGQLKQPAVLEAQVKRMLADKRADALVDNFAEQWLFLRNLKSTAPNMEAYPDFDDNLRQAMKQETKMFFGSILRENRSTMDLLNADYTFVNERLARHYGIAGIYGSQFRRVPVTDPNRRGLLGQASILTVTAYPNRTSPVQRGKWVLTNLLGVPPQPPPPNVPALEATGAGKVMSLRERMEAHRANAVCAGCHKVMDPVGFALENYDGIGRWRTTDEGAVIDPSGTMFNGTKINGPADLRQMIASRPNVFVGVVTERLLTYALGRPIESFDMPAVRKIVRDSAGKNFQFASLITGVVESIPFQMKTKKAASGDLVAVAK